MNKAPLTLLGAASMLALSACAATGNPELLSPPAVQPATGDTLVEGFRSPPKDARPRTWWHWMNGNISQDGIAKDLAWMDEIGLGGVQMFDVGLQVPQVVDERITYMTPEWKAAFRLAATEAERRGLEFAIASSPGWSETGGPWVAPADAMKKLVWSEVRASGGTPVGTLPAPPTVTGPFQSQGFHDAFAALEEGGNHAAKPRFYRDIAVLAVSANVSAPLPTPQIRIAGAASDGAALFDGDLDTGVAVPKGEEAFVEYDYPRAVTVRSAQTLIAKATMPFSGPSVAMALQAYRDGAWRDVVDIPVTEVPTTLAFQPVTARRFRLRLTPAVPQMSNMGAPEEGAAPPPFAAALGAAAAQPYDLRLFSLSGEARVNRFESKAGFATEPDYYALGDIADGASGPAPGDIIDVTRFLTADGTLDWVPPAGQWTVLRMGYSLLGTTNHPAAPEATGLEVDKYDAAAVRRYLDHYLGLYADALDEDLSQQDKIDAILTDSIEAGEANWTPEMTAQFRRLRGYDPLPWMPALTGMIVESREATDRFLYDYRRTLAELLAQAHYGTIADVAHASGLKVYGEALEDHRPGLGDDMAMRKHADYPMAAMWTYARDAGPAATYVADIKGAASVANLYGREAVAAESMTSALAYWAHAPRDLKRVMDLELVTGVNRPVIHTSVHQPTDDAPGLSLLIFGQFFNRHESWAPLARPWMDYIARSSFLLQQGRHGADVAYFHGEEAPLTSLYGDSPVADAPTGHGYDFVNADALNDVLSVEGGMLVTPSGMRYRLLYLGGSSRMMTLPTLRRIEALVREGAVVAGNRPEASPSLGDDPHEFASVAARLWSGASAGNGRVITADNADDALAQLNVTPRFAYAGGDGAQIDFLQRHLNDGDLFFVVNRRNRAETGEARFRVTGKRPTLWHAETGEIENVSYRMEGDRTVVPLALDAEEAVFVVFREDTGETSANIAARQTVKAGTIDTPWSVAFQEGRGAPASTVMTTLTPLNENADESIRYFSGVASYRNRFDTPVGWAEGAPLWLDLGEVNDIAEVRVNGQQAGGIWHAPWRIDIGHLARAGANDIEIRVANRWINRLIGDAQPGVEEKIGFTVLPTYAADAPLRPSGLVGPVTLLVER